MEFGADWLDFVELFNNLVIGVVDLAEIGRGWLVARFNLSAEAAGNIVKIAGGLMAIASASVGIWLKLRLAEINLQRRLEDFLSREQTKVRAARPAFYGCSNAGPSPAVFFTTF